MGEFLDMTWKEKFEKMQLLDPEVQVVRKGKKFSINSKIKIGGYLTSERPRNPLKTIFVSEDTPMQAVAMWWNEAVSFLICGLYLCVNDKRYAYDYIEDTWNEVRDDLVASMLKGRKEGIEYRRKLRAEEREQERIGVPVNLDKYEDSDCNVEPQKKATINWRAIGGGAVTVCKWVVISLLIAVIWAAWESSKKDK